MTRFERWAVWSSSILVTVTGLVYLGMKYLLPEPEGFTVIRHPLQPLVLTLHIMVAPLFIFALGTVTLRHIWRHITTATREGRYSGWTASLTVLPMVFTGYLLQVVTGEGWVWWLGIAHIVTGVVFAAGLVVHQVMVRRHRHGPGRDTRVERRGRAPRKTGARRIPA